MSWLRRWLFPTREEEAIKNMKYFDNQARIALEKCDISRNNMDKLYYQKNLIVIHIGQNTIRI